MSVSPRFSQAPGGPAPLPPAFAPSRGRGPLAITGALLLAVGLALVVVANFLHYAVDESLWSFNLHRGVVIVIVVAVAAAGFTLVAVVTGQRWPALVVLALAGWIFGTTFNVITQSYAGLQIGYWLGACGGLAALTGAGLLAAGTVSHPGAGRAGSPSRPMAMSPQAPPPGWYPDPAGAGQRYWDGVAWTAHVSG